MRSPQEDFKGGRTFWEVRFSLFHGGQSMRTTKIRKAVILVGLAIGWATGNQAQAGVIFADGPIYHFDEGSGTIAPDASGYHADGTLYNNPTWTTGKYGGALQFDGMDDYVHVSSFPSGQYGQLTVEAWIYPLDQQGKQGLINEQNGDTLWMNFDTNGQDKLDIYLGDTTYKGYHSSNTAISRNTWTHVAFTYNDQTDELKLYINGQLDRTITTSGLLNFDTSIRFGRPEYNNEPFKGLIDEIAFYFRALSDQEIYARYLAGPPVPVPEPANAWLLAIGLLGLVGVGKAGWRRGPKNRYCLPSGFPRPPGT